MHLFAIVSYILSAIMFSSNGSLSAQDTTTREGLLFFYSSDRPPLQGVFVEKTLEVAKSIYSNMQKLNDRNDTGILIPIFQLNWQKNKSFEHSYKQAVSFTNGAAKHSHTAMDTSAIKYPERFISKVLPVRLTFVCYGYFKGPFDDDFLTKTQIIFKGQRLVSVSKDKPSEWGVLTDLQIIDLASVSLEK